MFFTKYIDPFYFICSLAVGIFFVYIMRKKPRIVLKQPTPENAGSVTYVDDVGVCYKYEVKEVPCPNKE
jgi:hypothetical protein